MVVVRRAFASIALFLAVALGSTAGAQTTSWTAALSGPAPAAPTTDGSFASSPSVYVGQGSNIYAFNAASTGGGGLRWSTSLSPSSLANFPSPVPTRSGKNVLFVTTTDGTLYAFDVSTPTSAPPILWSKSLRRDACPDDQVTATPAVQLYNYSNSTFQSAIGDDLVIVPTHHMCSDTTGNLVYGIKGSTGTVAWTFNSGATYAIDYATEGCAIDYATNRVYCGFNQPGTQNTLYALSTATTNAAGARAWAVNVGSVRTRPTLRNNKVYVGTYNGFVQARNAATGASAWGYQVSTSYAITSSVYVETHNQAALPNLILVRNTNGDLYALDDTLANPVVWTNLGFGASSMVVAEPSLHRVYVGKGDGTLHELKLERGGETVGAIVGSSTGTVYDPSVHFESGASGGSRILAVSNASLAMFRIPFVAYTCNDMGCDGAGGGNIPNYVTCSTADGGSCAPEGCTTGSCPWGDNIPGPCERTYSCAQTCCWGAPDANGNPTTDTCTNLNTDPNNCGFCGNQCARGQLCTLPSGADNPICTCTTASCRAGYGPSATCNTTTGACSCNPSTACGTLPGIGAACGPANKDNGCGGICARCAPPTGVGAARTCCNQSPYVGLCETIVTCGSVGL